jgi:type I restriction enzyme S subunit
VTEVFHIKDGVTKEFIFHLLQESRLHQFVVSNSERTAGQSGVNLDLLEAYDAYLPPMTMQLEFERQLQSLTKLKLHHSEATIASSALFEALQQSAFQGTL